VAAGDLTMPPAHDRALEIDGIRGWASFSVLLYHTFHEMFTRLLPWMNSAWLAPLFEGRIAVCVFFVLSGDALSNGFLARGGTTTKSIDRLAVRRYTRLTVPILMSCILVYGVRLLHADWHDPAAVILDRTIWLSKMAEFDFSLIGMFRYALLGVYVSHSNDTSYNPFLWTMSLEMIGSMLIFLTCYLWPRLRQPKTVVAGAALILFAMNSFYCLFFAGMYLGVLRTEDFYAQKMGSRTRQLAALAGFFMIVALLMLAYNHHMPLFFDLAVSIAMVFLLYSQRGLRNWLRGPLSTWMGDVSFPIYLVQFVVMISFESWLIVVWDARQAGTAWLPALGLASVAVTLVVAWLFRQVERASLNVVDGQVLRLLRKD
jgi:peptidoglycan/LPS O-acetylase OafA/YrhL